MSGKILKEIAQTKPFATAEEEALMNLFRTTAVLRLSEEEALKPYRISPAAYNILRILRGSQPHGLRCQEVRARLLTPGPDVTRLLDRLAAKKLVSRERPEGDRRTVVVRISPAGLELLAEMDPLVRALPKKLLGHLGREKVERLIELLEDARGAE